VAADVYVFDGGLAEAAKARLATVVRRSSPEAKLHWLEIDSGAIERLMPPDQVLGYVSPTTLARLFLGEVIPQSCRRAIYIDSDTLVKADLHDLWKVAEGGDSTVWAVHDVGTPFAGSAFGIGPMAEAGCAPEAAYCNAGVLLVNLDRWRAERIGERAAEYLVRFRDRVTMADQEAINVALAGSWSALEPRWNQQGLLFDFDWWTRPDPQYQEVREHEARYDADIRSRWDALSRQPFIVHFSGLSKPWKPDCNNPSRGEYLRELRKSGYHSMGEWVKWRGGLALRRAWWLTKTRSRAYRPSIRPLLNAWATRIAGLRGRTAPDGEPDLNAKSS
jgi:lipopolysaccharide biosynthesis glycosyltransferase